MSRPSPQEQARECRACVYWRAESEHIVSTCSARSIAVKGHETCCDFRPAPPRPPASPPVSADREGTDWLEPARQVLESAWLGQPCVAWPAGTSAEVHVVGHRAYAPERC